MKKKESASFSCSKEFLEQLDQRASALGMSRTQYITQLIRQDLAAAAAGKTFQVAEDHGPFYGERKVSNG